MFETEDGIWDADGATAEEKENFFKMYPNAKRAEGGDGGGEPTADDKSWEEKYSNILPEFGAIPTDSYADYRKKGAERKPEGAIDATVKSEGKQLRIPGKSFLNIDLPEQTTSGKRYIANNELELEDGSKIYLTLNEMQNPERNPILKAKEEESKNNFLLPDGVSANAEVFKPYKKKAVDFSKTGNLSRIREETVAPYKPNIDNNRSILRELGSGSTSIPEQYRYWEGDNPPEDLVMNYTAYTLHQQNVAGARRSEYDKAVAELSPEEQEATKKQTELAEQKATEFLDRPEIKNIDSRVEAYKNDPRYIENINIINKYEYEGEELTKEEAETYQRNFADLSTVRSGLLEDYEKLDLNISEMSDASFELGMLRRDYSLLNKMGFNASTTFSNLVFGGLEVAAAGRDLLGFGYGAEGALVEAAGQKRREILEKERETYRESVAYGDAFDDFNNFGRFIAEEAATQLPIMALIAASGGSASALGAGEMGAALFSAATLGAMSAGQQIGDMTRQEFLSKYNDIQAYGKNLEYNDKEYSDLNKFLTGVGFGAAEGLLGAAPTFILGSRFLNAGTRMAINAGKKGLASRVPTSFLQKALNYGKPVVSEYAVGFVPEAITEGATTLMQNIITRNPNVWEGVDHAAFSGGFFGGGMGASSVAMGVAMNSSMNSKERLELQDLYDTREMALSELKYEGLSPDVKIRLKKSIADFDSKIEDKTIEVEERWLSKMSRKNFDDYVGVLGKQADLKKQYNEINSNNSGLTKQQKTVKVEKLALEYQNNHAMIERFRNPLDYANRWHLLESIDKKRYDKIKQRASEKILREGFEVTSAKVKKEAYDMYLLEEIAINGENAKKAMRNLKLKYKSFEFKTEKEAKDFANEKIKELGINPDDVKNQDNFWVGLSKAPLGKLNGQAGTLDGAYAYVTTEENQLKNEREGTATHEVGHLIFWDWIENRGLNVELVAKDITKFLKQTNPKIYSEMFGQLETQAVETEAGVFKPEEIIMGFIERIGRIDKNKKVSKTFMYKLGQIFNSEAGVTTDLSTQPAIVGFISSIGEKIKDGTLTLKDIEVAESSKVFKDLLPKDKVGDVKVKPETKSSISLLENINNLVPKDVKTKADFQGRKVFNPIFNATQPGGAIYNYVNSRAVSKEEANITLEGVVDRLINYDPAAVRKTKSGEPITFGEFLFANARFSKLDAKKRLAIESATRAESLDTEEARQVAEPVAEETTEAPRVEYKNLVESKVLPTEMAAKVKDKIVLITKTLKSRIDAATSINKTVTPLMSEIKKEIGKQADIEFKKMLGAKRGGELETNYLKLKQPILENMTTTWLMQSMPFAIQKSVDGKFTSDWEGKKIDRESVGTDKAGRTAGAQLVKRLPNAASKITDKQFLTYMFKDSEVIRGRKEALAKAMAEEYAFDIYSQELKNPDSEIRKAFKDNQERLGVEIADNLIQEFSKQSERGNVKRSISNETVDIYRNALDLHINDDIDGAETLIRSLNKVDQDRWEEITEYLSAKSYGYKKNLKNLEVPSNVSSILEDYFANNSIKDNKLAMKQMYEFATDLIDSLPNSLAKALGADFFGAHYRYLDPKQIDSLGYKIREKIKSLEVTDANVGFEVNDIRLVQAGSGIVLDITKNILNKEFESADKKIEQFESEYGDEVRALNYANGKAIETIVGNTFDIAVANKNRAVGFLRMLESTTNIGKSLRALTGIMDIQMTAKSQAVYIDTKTGKGFSNVLSGPQKLKLKAGEIVINKKHPNYSQALDFIKKGSKQSIAQLLRVKGEHATPSSNFNSDIAENFLESLSIAKSNPGSVVEIKRALIFKIKESLQEFNQQLNTKVLSDIQDAKLGTTSDIGEARLLAMPKEDMQSFYDISGTQRIGKINRAILGIFDKGMVEKRAKLATIDKAVTNSNKRSYSENPKGISVYDFDDTLAFSKSQVIVNKDGKSYMITPAEFAAKGEQLLAEGAEFDFSEFNKVVKGTPGPLIPRLEKAIKKFGNENIFILTARPVASESAIHDFMKGLGLEIPRANITGLANSTAQAKADWMVGKVAEGYNDFYFTDDHYKNVKAVQDVLETFDVKSKVQQAVAKRKSSMSSDLNEMIERNKGVKAEATFSKVLARKKGASKGKAKFFVPYSAEDFRGLTSYTLAGKGKQGELDQAVFEKALILPYTRGVAKMEGAGQALKNDYRNLLKMFDLKKELGKKIADTGFTTDQAVRVYLWTQQGIEVPNISKRDQKQLNSVVSKNPDLVGFSEGLMAVSKKDNWVNPKEHWDVGSILKDLNEITEKINRKEYLAEFIENADEMFNPTNLNKLEAVYGTAYIEALQDSIRRMKSGSNRPAGVGKIEQKWLNWVNNSVGTIMFFNRRSALLQMLSFTNFINWSDNNPLRAAEAFANQPLYWKTWTKIFNSDKLKERRGGLKSDIQESEIANQARNSEDKAAAVLSYLLKVGFTPTQIADSFAIATGGATFLINRTRKYEKQGLSKKEAEAKAFEDFSLKSDETQQSGDPMLISQQQSSHLGRLVLAFQNTPMQYTRLIKKASKDLINGRGSTVENVSKIAYYGFVQNLIFSSLQSALFAMVPGFDDEEEEEGEFDKKAVRTVNSMIDTLLRGSGLAGAVVATIKNAIMKYQSEKEKGFTADHTYTVLELANVSPPIGSKLRKVYSAIQTEKYNKDVLDYMGMHVLLDGKLNPSPAYEIISNLASAGLNIPADRLLVEIKSINEALDSRNTAYQRAALALGWKTYDVNVKNEEQDLIKAYFKAERKEQGKAKAKQKREDKKKEEQDRIKAMSPQERGEYNNEKYRKKVAAARKAAETRRKNRANR